MDTAICYKSGSGRSTRNLVQFLLIIGACLACEPRQSETRILFVGDILLSRNVSDEIATRKTFPWESLRNTFESANYVIGNLEGAVGTQSVNDYGEQAPVFPIDSGLISLLDSAGFNIITMENNHSMDLGLAGKKTTFKVLKDHNLNPVSYENSPYFILAENYVVAIVALNTVISRDSSRNVIPSVAVSQKLRLAKSLSNLVIVSIHWGSELLDWPNKDQRESAEWLIDEGADIIIGSHPHIIQEPELIKGKPVFYSLGNHLFDQKYLSSKKGMIAEIVLKDGWVSVNGILTKTQDNSFYPEETDRIMFPFEPLKIRSEALKFGQYNIKPLSIGDLENNLYILEAYNKNKKLWKSHRMPLLTITKCKLDGEDEYLFALEKHYSPIDHEESVRPYVYKADGSGLIASWRGSALAWPLIDAKISPIDQKTLCVLHRGDTFIELDKENKETRVAAYQWNGFGFSGINDSVACNDCKEFF